MYHCKKSANEYGDEENDDIANNDDTLTEFGIRFTNSGVSSSAVLLPVILSQPEQQKRKASVKDTVRSLSMFFLISIFSTKYLFSYNNIIIIRKPIH